MSQRKRNQLLARNASSLGAGLNRIWIKNGKVAGVVPLGLALTEVFFTDNPWVSVQYLTTRVGIMSADSVRRRLEEMVDLGLAEVMEVDTKKVYRATPEAAGETIKACEAALIDA